MVLVQKLKESESYVNCMFFYMINLPGADFFPVIKHKEIIISSGLDAK